MTLGPRARLAATVAVVAVVAIACCVLAPLRDPSGDVVAARLGGVVLRCGGDFDLSRVDWIRRETDRKRLPYYVQRDAAGQFSSVFGPVPAVIAAGALLDFGAGDTITDAMLRSRERYAAALCLGLAVALLTLAAAARCGLARSALTGGLAAASFAGAATLGQALWQATTALPLLAGALAAHAWRERFPRVALATPALLVVGVLMRPTIAPLALGFGVAWLLDATGGGAGRAPGVLASLVDSRGARARIVALAIAVVAAAPLVAWNVVHLGSPFPIGQWIVNSRVSDAPFSLGGFAAGFVGLLVSPGRGVLWFAPIVLVGIVAGLRGTRTSRVIAGGVVLQILVMSAFHRWHGGLAYGPRFLTEACWIAIWLALGTGLDSRGLARIVLGVAIAITIVAGQLGLWRFEIEQWETRRRPETDSAAFWDFVDSPIAATLTSTAGIPHVRHAPELGGLRCFTTGYVGSVALPAR